MSRARTASLAAAAALAACTAEVRQPVAYNHALHVKKLELACDGCHEGSRTGEVAGLPAIATCAACHHKANGTSASQAAVVAAVSEGREIARVLLHGRDRHVYFTLRRHVAVARIVFKRCNGDMGAQ